MLGYHCQSITLESSFYGYTTKDGVTMEYYPDTLKKVGRDLLKCLMLIQSKSHLPIAQQTAYWTNSPNFNFMECKFGNEEDEGSDEDPTGDYIEEIQKKVVKIRQTYKLDNTATQKAPKTTSKPSFLTSKKPTPPADQLPVSKSLRRRITSSYARVPNPHQVNQSTASTILKNYQPPASKLFCSDTSREFSLRRELSKSRLRKADIILGDINAKFSKLMSGMMLIGRSNQTSIKKSWCMDTTLILSRNLRKEHSKSADVAPVRLRVYLLLVSKRKISNVFMVNRDRKATL